MSFHLALKDSNDDRDVGDIITTQHLSECQTQDILSVLSNIAIKSLNDRIETLTNQVDKLIVENERLRYTIHEYELVVEDCFVQLAECEARCYSYSCPDYSCHDVAACVAPE